MAEQSRPEAGYGTAEPGSQPDSLALSCSRFVLQITHPWAELSGAILAYAAHSCQWELCSRSSCSIRSRDGCHVRAPCTMECARGLPQLQRVIGDTGKQRHSRGRLLVESRWHPWLLEVWGPYGTRNLPFSWLLAVRCELYHLKAGADTNFLDPLCTWCLEARAGCSGGTAEPASSRPVTSSAAHRQGSRGAPGDGACAVRTGLAGLKAGLLCDCSGRARRGYQRSWKLVALCLKEKLNEISAVTLVPLFSASLSVLVDCAALFAYLEDYDMALK